MAYPLVGTFLNERSFSAAVDRYKESSSAVPEEERRALLAEARAYNDSLRGDPVRDPFIAGSGWAQPEGYECMLDADGSGIMGTVEVPSIGVRLPLRHGTSDEALAQGAGHLPQTSLPVGGAGTHAVITGHTGLPTARLFDDLVRLKRGDVFIIEVLGQRRAYAVDDIRTVDPDEVEAIRVDEEHEYVTLLTCTPYGLNTQRLLVRGSPCSLPVGEAPAPPGFPPLPLTAAAAVLLAIAAAAAASRARRRRRARARARRLFPGGRPRMDGGRGNRFRMRSARRPPASVRRIPLGRGGRTGRRG